ncbi:MAG: hypothetical protein ACOC33_01285 [bacterium]
MSNSNQSIRIRAIPDGSENDKYLKIKLEQNFDYLEVLSLKISQTDVLNFFNADYGVVVGRVIANGGVGVPNAKISIFIPLDEEDEDNSDVVSIYPYKSPNDTNIDGTRYNLLPRVKTYDPYSGFEDNQNINTFRPVVPVGTFPTKHEILTNPTYRYVYKKYYKYTTVTNNSGDYMLFGVPVGVQTIHMSVDITNIGKYSMTPATMISALGYSPNLFDGNRIIPSNDLDELPNVQTQETSIDVRPFWGDSENFEIGVTRQDFKLRGKLVASTIVFGSFMTMGSSAAWGNPDNGERGDLGLHQITDNRTININVESNRVGNSLNTRILYYPPNISDQEIDDDINNDENNIDINTDILLLDESEYESYLNNGNFAYVIPCNRNKVITDEFGNERSVEFDNPNGIFSEFRGMFLIEHEDLDLTLSFDNKYLQGETPKPARVKMKIPQETDALDSSDDLETLRWIKKSQILRASEYYSVAQFYMTYAPGGSASVVNNPINLKLNNNLKFQSYVLANYVTGDTVNIVDNTIESNNYFPSNFRSTDNPKYQMWGAQWLNFLIYFPQFTYVDTNNISQGGRSTVVSDAFVTNVQSMIFLRDNANSLGDGLFNTKWYLRGDGNPTQFVHVEREDILTMLNNPNTLAFRKSDLSLIGNEYRYRRPNIESDLQEQIINGAVDEYFNGDDDPYFCRGIRNNDCISFLSNLGLI